MGTSCCLCPQNIDVICLVLFVALHISWSTNEIDDPFSSNVPTFTGVRYIQSTGKAYAMES